MAQEQQPQASLDAPPMQTKLKYMSSQPSLPHVFSFRPNDRTLVAYFMAPKAFYGRIPDDTVQDAIADGVDVYGTRPQSPNSTGAIPPMAQEQQPQASLDAPPMQTKLKYMSSQSSLPHVFSFQPNGRTLVAYFMAPKAFYGRIPDDTVQDAIADGVDVYGTRPEDLPFWSCNRNNYGKVWGHFITTAASGGDFRDVTAGGSLERYGKEKVYTDEDGDVVASRRRFAFFDAEGNLTPWRMKEFRLNEGAAAFRGIAFHPCAKDMVVWKVYNHVEIPEEILLPLVVDYHSSDEDRDDGDDAEEIVVDGAGVDAAAYL